MPDESYVLDILDSLVHVGRPILLQYFSLDSCIASSNVSRQILWAHHIYAEAAPVKAYVVNAKGDEFLRKGHPEWVKGMRDGAYAVGVGYGGPNPDKWDGHLVLVVDHRYLVDMSGDQFARPEYGIEVKPFYARLDGVDLTGRKSRLALGLPNGGVLLYEGDPDNQLFRRAPDWLRPYREVVRDVSKALSQDLLRRRATT